MQLFLREQGCFLFFIYYILNNKEINYNFIFLNYIINSILSNNNKNEPA